MKFATWCELDLTEVLPLGAGLPFRPLVPQLSWIKPRSRWNLSIMRTLVRVPEQDFDYIQAEFSRHASR
jgi:hypothetical protein